MLFLDEISFYLIAFDISLMLMMVVVCFIVYKASTSVSRNVMLAHKLEQFPQLTSNLGCFLFKSCLNLVFIYSLKSKFRLSK